MTEYTPYLLTQDEADLLSVFRQFQANKRGSTSPSGVTDAGLPTVQVSPEVLTNITLTLSGVSHIIDLVAALGARVDANAAALADAISSTKGTLKTMTDAFDAEMTALHSDVSAQTTVIASAAAAFQGLASQVTALEAKLAAAGATPDQVAMVTSFRTQLESNTAALAAAIPANTPAAAPAAGGDTSAGGGASTTTSTSTPAAGGDASAGGGASTTTSTTTSDAGAVDPNAPKGQQVDL